MSMRKLVFVGSTVLVAAVCLTLSTGGSAWAKPGYAESSLLSTPSGFSEPMGVGVDNSMGVDRGDVYVSNRGSNELEQFSSAGVLLQQVSVPGAGLSELTVDSYPGSREGDIYVAGLESGVIYRFTPGLNTKEEIIRGLERPEDVTVDEAGDIFVAEQFGQVLEFTDAGEPVNAKSEVVAESENVIITAPGTYHGPDYSYSLAVTSDGTQLYLFTEQHGTLQYDFSGGIYVEEEAPLDSNVGFNTGGVAITPAGYVDAMQEVSNERGESYDNIAEFEPSGKLVTTIETSDYEFSSSSIGISESSVSAASGKLYVAGTYDNYVLVYEEGELSEPTTESDSQLYGDSVTLNGALDGGESEYHFVYTERSNCEICRSYVTATVRASGAQKVHAEITGLEPNREYSYYLVATNRYGSEAGSFAMFQVGNVQPRIAQVLVSPNVHSASVSAQIDPEQTMTVYEVEYGTAVPYSNKTAETVVGSGEASVAVKMALTGLIPDTVYHYRIVARNAVGVVQSSDGTFATYSSVASRLPDGRVYEMVSPANNPYQAEVYEVNSGLLQTDVPFQASADGNKVVYAGYPTSDGTGGSGEDGGQQYLATRSPAGGWAQVNVTPPDGKPLEKFAVFSDDLSYGVIPSASTVPLHPVQELSVASATEEEHEVGVLYEKELGGGLYIPLFTVAPQNRIAEKAAFLGALNNEFEMAYAGASADFRDQFFEANDALIEGGGEAERELAANAKREGEQVKEAIRLGREQVEPERREQLESVSDNFALYESTEGHVSLVNILPDGKIAPDAAFGGGAARKPYSEQPDLSGAVSRDGSRVFWSGGSPRDVYVREDGSRTVQVSAGSATYWTASADGRYAYYIEKGELWRFDVELETREQITPEGAIARAVLGTNQAGEDGAYVYFVSTADLTGEEENAEKAKAEKGNDNLYVLEPDPEHPGRHVTRFIAGLTNEEGSDSSRSLGERTAEISANGQSIVFESTNNLTGHSYPSEGSEEVYEYRADEGRLFCVSCRPQASGGFLEPTASAVQMRRWVSEDGDRVFFESEAPLVEQDTNGARDVYEWEPAGAGECVETEGCIYLLSGGVETTAFFADASANGDDVFIATRQRLTVEDENELVDLYDARVDGARAVTPPECTGTGCQGVPAQAPIFATPSSVTFNGVGNFTAPPTVAKPKTKSKPVIAKQKLERLLRACRKKRMGSRRHECESKARKRYDTKTGKGVKKGAR